MRRRELRSMMRRVCLPAWLAGALLLALVGCQADAPQQEQGSDAAPKAVRPAEQPPGTGDAEAIAVADRVMKALGGKRAWEDTRYLAFSFFGTRRHWWDKETGNLRIEANDLTIIMNVWSQVGSARKAGAEIVDPDELASTIQRGYQWWINDSYWMLMPYKLRDPGVHLRYLGERKANDGSLCDVIELTFTAETGHTPENKYDVYVSRENDLVVQWSFYPRADDAQPKFTMPWGGWQKFGKILLATQHGQGKDWRIEVPSDLPESVFREFDPVS